MTTVAKGDFVELVYTARVNGTIVDSNKAEDLKQINVSAEPEKTTLIIGEGMVVKGLDKALENKEIGKEYHVTLSAADGFGPRHASLIRPIPLKIFLEKNIHPRVGMSLVLDRSVVQVRAISGARVIADFNNPLAGKNLEYTFTAVRKIGDVEEKTKIFFHRFTRTMPDVEFGETVLVKGFARMQPVVELLAPKFKELVGKTLTFKQSEEGKEKAESRDVITQQSL